jgi:4-hydroxy-tetrahydrodipicolinate synthase
MALVGGSFLPYSVAMVTPFDAEGEFDPAAVAPLVSHLVSAGAPGLLISGSTGEQHCLSIEERCTLYKLAREAAGPGVKLYAGVATVKTKLAVTLAQAAAASQMDGIMLGFTPYNKYTQRDGAEYAKTVAAAVPDTPIFLYNNSGRQPFNLEPSTFVSIMQAAPNVKGVKEVVNARVLEFKAAVAAAGLSPELAYFSGSDAIVLAQFAEFGYNGLTSVVGQVYTKEMAALVEKLQAGDAEGAAALWEREVAAGAALLAEGGALLQSIKHVLRGRGAPAGHCCLPLQPLTAEQAAKLDAHFDLAPAAAAASTL